MKISSLNLLFRKRLNVVKTTSRVAKHHQTASAIQPTSPDREQSINSHMRLKETTGFILEHFGPQNKT